jgi:predicted GH43/DUF377 family glycosyl hydrolase
MDRETYLNKIAPTRAGWVKYENNPVLGGALGTCFDLTMLEEDGGFSMYFSWRPKKSIALTKSQDGIHWSDPVIVLGPRETAEGWETDLNRPTVVKRDGVYHMWYTGQKPGVLPRGADGRSWIFYATSQDGVHFERVCLEPVISAEAPWEKAAVMCPHVLWDAQSGLFKMWYSGGEQYEPNAIGYASSADGVRWNKYPANPIFFADPSRAWEQHKVAGCQVLQHEGWYLMFYIGYWDEDTAQIGIARSRNGLTDWERHPANPIVAPTKDAWDGEACYKPYVILSGDTWRLWYNGRNGAPEQIGLVTHPGKALGF